MRSSPAHVLVLPLVATVLALSTAPALAQPAPRALAPGEDVFVSPTKGRKNAKGTQSKPHASISAALAALPEPLTEDVTIRLVAGDYTTTGGLGMSESSLALMHRMRPGVSVRFASADAGEPIVLNWRGDTLVEIAEGRWHFEGVQIGSFAEGQRRGVEVYGSGEVVLDDVSFELRSESDVAIYARNGGHALLRGALRLNAELHESAPPKTFSGILAEDHGIVEFDEYEGSSLDMGNGSLSVRTWGRVALGCDWARITCWTSSNNLTINNSGRIDARNTPITLRATNRKNTPIGLEHDGHILAEDAHITVVGPNDSAIALQKASTFTCNDIELKGEFEYTLWASSGSMFVGRFLTDVTKLKASTGAQIHVEKIAGELKQEPEVRSGGLVTLPDRVVRSD